MRKFGTFIVVFIIMTALSFVPANAAAKKAPKKNAISWETLCAAVRAGEQAVGKPYKLGSKGPNAFDCSGLMCYIFKTAGAAHIYGTSKTLAANEKWQKIDRAQDLQAGDLVFWGNDVKVTHVGLYLGDDMFLDSTPSGGGVRIGYLSVSNPYFQEIFDSSPTWLGRRLLDAPAPASRVPLSNPPSSYNDPFMLPQTPQDMFSESFNSWMSELAVIPDSFEVVFIETPAPVVQDVLPIPLAPEEILPAPLALEEYLPPREQQEIPLPEG